MSVLVVAALAAWCGSAAQSAAQGAPPPPAAQILPTLIRNFTADQVAEQGFEHREHVVLRKDGTSDGRTLRVWFVAGRAVSETVAVDGRSLSQAEIAAEQERAAQRAAFQQTRAAAPAGWLEVDRQRMPFEKLAADFRYGAPSERTWNGRATWVYPVRADRNVAARSRGEAVLLAAQGEIWVDAEELHVVRIDMHTVTPVRYWLGVLATVRTASMDLQLERQAAGVWVPLQADFSMEATVALVRGLARSRQQSFYGYARR